MWFAAHPEQVSGADAGAQPDCAEGVQRGQGLPVSIVAAVARRIGRLVSLGGLPGESLATARIVPHVVTAVFVDVWGPRVDRRSPGQRT